MVGRIVNVQISCPGATDEEYEQEAGQLALLYGELLGMHRIDVGYMKLVNPDRTVPEIGFEGTRENRVTFGLHRGLGPNGPRSAQRIAPSAYPLPASSADLAGT